MIRSEHVHFVCLFLQSCSKRTKSGSFCTTFKQSRRWISRPDTILIGRSKFPVVDKLNLVHARPFSIPVNQRHSEGENTNDIQKRTLRPRHAVVTFFVVPSRTRLDWTRIALRPFVLAIDKALINVPSTTLRLLPVCVAGTQKSSIKCQCKTGHYCTRWDRVGDKFSRITTPSCVVASKVAASV